MITGNKVIIIDMLFIVLILFQNVTILRPEGGGGGGVYTYFFRFSHM